ncbi:hypothetical protein [Tenacibaculum aiptasiae]|uniref:hypothetical protein n=1 Tax=Tenacibaculum aiptasiae TaxID=426481 RepID=UPI003B5C18B7
MKTKKNKKFYNFTEEQKRRDSHRLYRGSYPIGKELKVWANRKFRRDNRVILKRTLKLEKDMPYIRHRKFLDWYAN